jgi:hypothetical protein
MLTGCCLPGGSFIIAETTAQKTTAAESTLKETTSDSSTETTTDETTSDSSSGTTAVETTSDSSSETTSAETTASETTAPETTAVETADQEEAPINKPPDVGEITISNLNPVTNTTYAISVLTSDPDGDLIAYKWSINAGALTSSITNPTNWKTPAAAGEYTVSMSVSDTKGHVVNKTKKIQVILPPPPAIVINDIVFPDKIYVNNPNVVTAILSDPSQEAKFAWSWDVGNGEVIIRGVNSKMAWVPDKEGQSEVTVTIKNEKGKILSTRTETALVVPLPIVSLSLNKVAAEGGYIELNGAVRAEGNLYAGDSNNNQRCTGFISFDITGLAGADVQSAEASFIISKGWGNPLEFTDYLSLTSYYWGPRAIRHGDDTADGAVLQTFEPATFACFNYELKNALQNAIDAGRPRFQLRIHFAGGFSSDDDNNWDGWEYPQNNIKLIVTYKT